MNYILADLFIRFSSNKMKSFHKVKKWSANVAWG